MLRLRISAYAFATLLACSGCAGHIQSFLVATRNHQGDLAYNNNNLTDASLAYKLVLKVAPQDEHARAGLAAVQLKLAAEYFRNSKFDDALAALNLAPRDEAQSVRLAQLRGEIEQARVKREIVLSNYPPYRETGFQLRRSYAELKKMDTTIIILLQRFDYDYDSQDVVNAIRRSYELQAEVGKLTARLMNFRQLIESGAPETAKSSAPLAPAASLLPLP